MYGVVPFVSRRSTGIVCGLVSAGGAVGGVINQAIFFLNTPTHGAYGTACGPECFADVSCTAAVSIVPLMIDTGKDHECGSRPLDSSYTLCTARLRPRVQSRSCKLQCGDRKVCRYL